MHVRKSSKKLFQKTEKCLPVSAQETANNVGGRKEKTWKTKGAERSSNCLGEEIWTKKDKLNWIGLR